MFKLPMDIQIKIYEYDPTYRDVFSNVLKEFHKVHSFWFIRFHDDELSKEMSTSKELITVKHFILHITGILILEKKNILCLMILTIVQQRKDFVTFIQEQTLNL